MKDKIQIALLAVIAVALGVIAWGQLKDSDGDTGTAPVVAATNSTANPATPAPTTFDPMQQAGEVVDNKPKTTINFANYEHDFGNVKQDSENKYVFTFTNTGTEPLIIEQANGSCGCTVPNYPKNPIPPGSTGEIEVEYKPGKQENAQTKEVTVIANTEPRETKLRIKAFVQKI